MAESESAMLPLAPLPDLVEWFRATDVRGLVIGAVAASLLGRPRTTRDVDAVVLVEEEDWGQFLNAGASFGFMPRVADALEFAKQSRVLLLLHQASGIQADICFALLPFEEEAIARGITFNFKGILLPLPTPEDLVIMKAVAHRDHDLADIQGILDMHPKLNLRRIRRWVSDFATTLDTPEILNDLERLLSQQRPPKRKKRNS